MFVNYLSCCMLKKKDKQHLLKAIINALEVLLQNARKAALLAYETATHEENIAENKYDTLGLEASYLAQGQAQRVVDCETDLAEFRELRLKEFSESDIISVGALVELIDTNNNHLLYFLGPAAGGLKIAFDSRDIVVITPTSPLGKALTGTRVDDEISLSLGAKHQRFEVVDII